MRRLILLAALLPALATAQPTGTPEPTRPLAEDVIHPDDILSWRTVPGATGHQVQIVQETQGFESAVYDEVITAPDPPEDDQVIKSPLGELEVDFGRYRWRLRAVDADGEGPWTEPISFEYQFPASTGEAAEGRDLRLAAWPVPARSSLSVRLDLLAPADVRFEAFDALGRRVAVLRDGPAAGSALLAVDVRGWTPGVYVVRAATAGAVATARVVVVR